MPEELYRPSNGTEGEMFMAKFCARCVLAKYCQIAPLTMIYHTDDPEYPREWVVRDGMPTCTAFVRAGFVGNDAP